MAGSFIRQMSFVVSSVRFNFYCSPLANTCIYSFLLARIYSERRVNSFEATMSCKHCFWLVHSFRLYATSGLFGKDRFCRFSVGATYHHHCTIALHSSPFASIFVVLMAICFKLIKLDLNAHVVTDLSIIMQLHEKTFRANQVRVNRNNLAALYFLALSYVSVYLFCVCKLPLSAQSDNKNANNVHSDFVICSLSVGLTKMQSKIKHRKYVCVLTTNWLFCSVWDCALLWSDLAFLWLVCLIEPICFSTLKLARPLSVCLRSAHYNFKSCTRANGICLCMNLEWAQVEMCESILLCFVSH